MGSRCERVLAVLGRKKQLGEDILATRLRRCLSVLDLTLLGFGLMVGAGIYVLTGTVARHVTGPAVFISYFISGLVALLSAICYAEFGARVPKAGSAYTYTYVTIGEPWAFIVGWNMILEYMLAGASVARALSGSINSLSDNHIRNWTVEHTFKLHLGVGEDHPDLVAFVSVLFVMIFVACGAKISVNFNNIFTSLNIICLVIIICTGLSVANIDNWTNAEHGGFLPFGIQGMLSGAATSFYAYVGFEGIAIASEESKNPSRAIPIATSLAMIMVMVLYVCCSAALTLSVPYYTLDISAPFPDAFARCGITWAKYVVAAGSLFGILTSIIGAIFSLPRAVYAMSDDGLLFRCLSYVHNRTKTPLVAIAVFGTFTAILALLVDIAILVEFLSIGTLLSFTMVSASVLILRYKTVENCQFKLKQHLADESDGEKERLVSEQKLENIGKLKMQYRDIYILKDLAPESVTMGLVISLGLSIVFFSAVLTLGLGQIDQGTWWAIILLILAILGIVGCFVMLLLYEQNISFVTFQVPLIPLFPALSMFFNILMMMQLHWLSWVRLACWITIGLLIYGFYGISHSSENRPLSSQEVHESGDSGKGSQEMQTLGTATTGTDM